MCRKLCCTPVDELPKAINIRTLSDLKQDILKRKRDKGGVHKAELCPHHGRELKIICKTCNNKVVCFECLKTKHREHKYMKLADYYNEHIVAIKEKLANICNQIARLQIAKQHLGEYEKEVLQYGKVLRKDINTHYRELADTLEYQKESLLDTVYDEVQSKVKKVKNYRRNATNILEHLYEVHTNLETYMKTWSKSKLIPDRKQIMSLRDVEEIKLTLSRAQRLLLSPTDMNIMFEPQPITDETMKFGEIVSTIQPQWKLDEENICWYMFGLVCAMFFLFCLYIFFKI